jgi:hypothetical protein
MSFWCRIPFRRFWGYFCAMFKFSYTVFQLLSHGICAHKGNFCKSEFLGSSAYKVQENELLEKGKQGASNSRNFKNKNEPKPHRNTEEKLYTINKKVVRRKMFSFANLTQSKKYFKLWTVSFPIGTQDDICYKLFNLWLTRMRKELGLKSYIWVAERQKNETIHYHLAFNSYFSVREANNLMQISVNNYIKKGLIVRPCNSFLNYNGIDISKAKGNYKAIGAYITKYVTKNRTKCKHLCYYCSQDISRLFTSQLYTEEQLQILEAQGSIKVAKTPSFVGEFLDFFCVDSCKYEIVFAQMFSLNNFIYSQT